MTEFISASEAKKLRSGINVRGSITKKTDIRTINLKSGGTQAVCDATLFSGETEDDKIKLTLWGDDTKNFNVGDNVEVINGYTNEFKGEVSLTNGKFGQLNKVQ